MQSILSTGIHDFSNNLGQILAACNLYITNQIPANAQNVENLTRQLVSDYGISTIPEVKIVVLNLDRLLRIGYHSNDSSEADFVSNVFQVVDIKEYNNMVLTIKDN